MRKNVEAFFEIFIMMLLLPTLIPVLTGIGVSCIMPTTSFGFLLVQAIIFSLRVIT